MKKAIGLITSILMGAIVGSGFTLKRASQTVQRQKRMSEKHLALYLMMNQWVRVKQEGKTLGGYFEKNGYKKIAVYGMSYAGETLLNELKDTGIEVAYGIDQKADERYSDVDIVSPDDELQSVDAIVVTPITFFDEIEEKLSKKIDCPILSLEDILYEA